ncbi:hypothetical protein VD0004_g6813 [Verticillium dahliae]|uniref:Anucleate primary sterigmata protein B n=2 Tax=Verticillium dahliae TaxID=27337 RepID=G2XI57_VERDV|nr:anucleate primary sterigmata protein B [Verticillium dahliae VdLs.17]KAF3347340.1 Transcription initiation factor TFIID subunit 6 [Verticillium dahliae VDG2]KAH6701818.1 anucleate primary sterigmata protein B [Verticillium dahliae]EGY19505.1 anucleate primary sterigmata protein B [Verticillium dahliae VdLs.17]PNH29848.1 hypothetical protein BJF96_g6969 [Verticillium dahliae]PNH40126.1 hypothetical protein VD0004_g6813 [Verticillium dahliae]
MDADENSRPASRDSESRPSTAHRVGGSSSFLGPADFDDSTVSPVKGGNDKTDDDIPGRSGNVTPLRRNDYPSLPPPNNAPEVSFVEGATFDDTRHGDDHAETAVRAHLQDVESSFMSRLSPLPTVTTTGADDTYLFDGASSGRTKSPTNRPFAPRAHTDGGRSDNELPQLRSDSVHTADVSNTTSSLETLSSSPTAAAARRTVSRALSSLSDDPRRQTSANVAHSADATDDDQSGADLSMSQSDASGEQSTDRGSVDVGSTPGHTLRYGKRPKYLRSRGTSQRSSTSSFVTNPESHDDLDSEGTVGLEIDYALQSGGATGPIMPRTMSNILSRTVSMGSMVSGMGINDTPEPGATPLETLEEVERSPHNRPLNEDLLKTPKPSKENLSAPTDTVIARHVRNVHVPESLAKEYRSKSGLTTPRKPSDMTLVGSGRSGKNLTLKEQSSTIERLSKENFDLKLKVMFLSDRLDKLSEEGVKEMISENVELKTSLAVVTRDNKALRRRVRELEKKLKEDEDRPSTARSGASSNDQTAHFFDHEANEREEELIYLRERVEEYVTEIERLKNDSISKEAEKRKLTEVVKSLGERTGENLGRQEEADVWKDLLEQETARREQADEDNKRMRDEIFRLKQEMTSSHGGSGGGLHHTTNIYNITKKNRQVSPSRPISGLSGNLDSNTNGGFSSTAPTLVEELRRESEQLRHENAELRREVGAQTSMLTSRNREKERLYQEIEDLKIAQRRGGPALSAVDSLLERSASRAGGHHRSMSRTSISRTQITEADEAEREQLENDLSEARDRINEVKLHNQELQRELDGCMEDFETAVDAKQQAEEAATALQEDLEAAMADLVALQAERDEALREQADMEAEFEALRKEAQEEIDALENEADQKGEEMQRLQLDLSIRSENFEALQKEMRDMSEAIVRLEDEHENKFQRIQQLEQDLQDANKESEDLETKLREANDKVQRLGVQAESSQSEIAFLREEQEGDKIKIGDLEAAIENAESMLEEERERVRELDQRLKEERRQREMVANQEKEEVQQFVNELNREMSTAKDEARRLRKNLNSREVEATEWKERLMELENNLREALGDLNGTRSSLLKNITSLQRQLENTVRELDTTKASLVEKDRIIKQRDALLESHGLELRKLSELLHKEQQGHRTTRNQFETFQKTHSHVSRTVTSQDSRITELEAGRAMDKKKMTQLEAAFREQLTERNNLLLVLWTRLSSLCGTDWAHNNSLINGRALPSLESVATMLPGFTKNLLAAVKTMETMVGGFQSRIKNMERDLWKDYQALEGDLDTKTKKLDRLESIVRNGVASGTLNSSEHSRMVRMEEAYRQLKIENATLRTASDVRSRAAYSAAGEEGVGSPSPSIPTGPRDREKKSRKGRDSERSSTLTRTSSSRGGSSRGGGGVSLGAETNPYETALAERGHGGSGVAEDKTWMLRLRDLEMKLKAEREGRNLDRTAARQRLGGLESENRDLRGEVMRMRRGRET